MRKEDDVGASFKGPYILRLAVLRFTGYRRQLRRILGQTISLSPLGMDLESGLRTPVGPKEAHGVRTGIEDTTGTRRRDTRETRHGASLRAEVGDGGACRS